MTTQLLDVLSDGIDHPEVWEVIKNSANDANEQPTIFLLKDYIALTLSQPTDAKTARSLQVLHAVCLAHLGNAELALDLLTKLYINFAQDVLVSGALFHVEEIFDPTNPKYQLKGKICSLPFDRMDILENSTHLCCAGWLPTSIGNLKKDDWQHVWNSKNAQAIRQGILDGSYRYCNKKVCPRIQTNTLPNDDYFRNRSPMWKDVIENRTLILDQGPERVNLSYDRTCNLSCPSCRPEKYAADEKTRNEYADMQERNVLPLLKNAKLADITGSGDPFASKNFRQVLLALNKKDYPNLKLQIMTNAMLLSPKEWKKFEHLNEGLIWRIRVSIDGASASSHEKIRRGAKWDVMLTNLAFIGELRKANHIELYDLAFVVQKDNFHEMADAVALGKKVGADTVSFAKVENWGTYSAQEFNDQLVWRPEHPLHEDFLKQMSNPLLRDPICSIHCFKEFLPKATAPATED